MSKTMAEVLVEHQRHNASSCLCGWARLGHSHPEHQAAALSAVGFGLVADAKVEAWDQGFASGKSRAMRHMSDEPLLPLNMPDPYRAAVRGEG